MQLSWTRQNDLRNAWCLWAIFTVVIALLGSLPAELRTVVPNYQHAALAWIHGASLYSGKPSGFLYFPQSAVAYIPFALLPTRLGEATWRVFCLLFLAFSLWKLSSRMRDHLGDNPFLWITLFTVPIMAGMARNGQMTTPLLATMILAAVAIIDKQWWPAVLWLMLGLALKPLILVFVLLLVVLYPPLAWRIMLGLITLLLLPLLTQRPTYVWSQYHACWHELTISAYPPGPNRFVDVFHLLAHLGLKLGDTARLVASILAGGLILLICWLCQRRLPHWLGAMLVLTWAVVYLMLFNPRVEHNTYGMFGPVVAAFAFIEWWNQRRPWLAWALIAADLLATFPQTLPFDPQLWVRQAMAMLFAGYLLSWCFQKLRPSTRLTRPSAEADTAGKYVSV